MMEKSILVVVLLLGLLSIANTINFTFSSNSFSYSDVLCIQTERQALLTFKQSLKDPSNLLSSWSSSQDCCKTWKGVRCHNTTHHVLGLHLSTEDEPSSLGGEISPSLLELKHLNYLDLSFNDFEGIRIPAFLGSIQNLIYLNLSGNYFNGTIPHQLGNLSSLRFLDLSQRYYPGLDAENLEWLSHLSSLRYLDMSLVNLTKASDHWLQVINMLPSLSELHLSSCFLINDFPSLPYVNFTSLAVLDLSVNNLGPSIPNWLFSLSGLVVLDLSYNDLQGTISDAIGNLTSIKELDLDSCNFEGEIPRTIEHLRNLRTLHLRGNKLNGKLSRFLPTNLEFLDLADNQLSGPLPDQLLGQFKNLEHLFLNNNSFSGPIPESIGCLSKLISLYLYRNSFEGVVSEIHFSNLTRLVDLDMDSTSLVLNVSFDWIPPFQLKYLYLGSVKLGTHQFPAWLRTQKDLHTLDLSNSEISDIIPTWFWNLSSQFFYLNLSHNHIKGELPKFLKSDYVYIYLQSNTFEGPLPRLSPSISELDLSNNSLSGPISDLLCNSGNNSNHLQLLDLSKNHLSGEIPDCWMYWRDLSYINLGTNNLRGNVPSSMGSLLQLQSLHLSNNNLSGELPLFLQNCTDLQTIDLNKNGFSGVIPRWMGKILPNLLVLGLRSNKFNGGIPLELCRLIFLQILDLAHNNLSGTIPQCFNNLSAMATKRNSSNRIYFSNISFAYVEKASLVMKGMLLEYSNTLRLVASIDLSSNSLSGEIPEELTNLLGLISLNLSENCLTGKIPEKIGIMDSLESLDFSVNKLSGVIPQSMANLNFLEHLNLSYNNLSGKIPTSTQLQSFSKLSYVGNQGLYGPPLTKYYKRGEASQDSNDGDGVQEGKDDFGIEMESFYLSMALGVVVGFWGVFGVLVFKKTWRDTYFRVIEDMKDKVCTLF